MIDIEERKAEVHNQLKKKMILIEDVKEVLLEKNYTVISNDKVTKKGYPYINYFDVEEKYQLNNKSHIVWIKFAKKKGYGGKERYVGVVGAGTDINRFWSNKNTSGKFVIDEANLEWDKENILIIPIKGLPKECKGHKTKERNVFERKIGQLLIDKDIPIIDYYSHIL